jgi:glycerate kinase
VDVLRVVIAPDSFKGSATAAAAAGAIADGWRGTRPDDRLTLLPQADGGEGTLDAMASAVPEARFHRVPVTGPDGREVEARWLELPAADGRTEGVVELAESSGLPLMPQPDAGGATTAGVGETARAAITAGVHSLVIGLGGSASTDGGAGALQALGLSIRDAAGAELDHGGRALTGLASVDATALLAPPPGGVRLLTDVTNPLLGERGAAAVFGPQKGAAAADVAELERALATWARLLGGDPDAPGAGAAGGTAYGLATAWGGRIVPGAPAIAQLTGLDVAAAQADVLIVGEGGFDRTSLEGKVVGHALHLAGPGTRVIVIAGRVDAEPRLPDGRLGASIALTGLAGSSTAAQAGALRWLREAGALAARD